MQDSILESALLLGILGPPPRVEQYLSWGMSREIHLGDNNTIQNSAELLRSGGGDLLAESYGLEIKEKPSCTGVQHEEMMRDHFVMEPAGLMKGEEGAIPVPHLTVVQT